RIRRPDHPPGNAAGVSTGRLRPWPAQRHDARDSADRRRPWRDVERPASSTKEAGIVSLRRADFSSCDHFDHLAYRPPPRAAAPSRSVRRSVEWLVRRRRRIRWWIRRRRIWWRFRWWRRWRIWRLRRWTQWWRRCLRRLVEIAGCRVIAGVESND